MTIDLAMKYLNNCSGSHGIWQTLLSTNYVRGSTLEAVGAQLSHIRISHSVSKQCGKESSSRWRHPFSWAQWSFVRAYHVPRKKGKYTIPQGFQSLGWGEGGNSPSV